MVVRAGGADHHDAERRRQTAMTTRARSNTAPRRFPAQPFFFPTYRLMRKKDAQRDVAQDHQDHQAIFRGVIHLADTAALVVALSRATDQVRKGHAEGRHHGRAGGRRYREQVLRR